MSKQTEQLLQAKNNELETELALKNRELEIEAALERVRSRTMGMHKSEELQYLVSVVFEQLQQLDFEIKDGAAFVGTFTDNSEALDLWLEDKITQKSSCFRIPHYDAPSINDIFETWNKGDDFVSDIYGEEKNIWFKYAFKNTDFKIVPEERKKWILNQSHLTQAIAFQKNSVIGVHVHKAITLSENEIDILKRFSEVFEQGYIRFLDLKKAEEQAREAQIEAALERVRSRTMAMHRSEELNEVIFRLNKEILDLGIELENAFIVTNFDPDNTSHMMDIWLAAKGQTNVSKFQVPYIEHKVTANTLNALKKGLTFVAESYTREEKDEYFKLLFERSDLVKLPEDRKQFIFNAPAWNRSTVLLKNSFLSILRYSEEAFTHEENEILKRFGNVFEQTYTRFLDLKKAETQAREARIEAALERVRTRSITMQKSNELEKVILVAFEQLEKLGFKMIAAFINLFKENSKDSFIYIGTPEHVYAKLIHIPYLDHPIFNHVFNTINQGGNLITDLFTKESKDEFFNYAFEKSDLKIMPEDRKKLFLDGKAYARSVAVSKLTGISVGNLEGIPYTTEQNKILLRLSQVFEQSYIRFLDLQKAEKQARETQIEAALERVRSRTMAIQKSDELLQVISLIFKELKNLYLDLFECSIVLVDKETRHLTCWMSGKHLSELPGSFKIVPWDHPFLNNIHTRMERFA